MDRESWIGCDLDGTLAEYHGWEEGIGPPIPVMLERVKKWLSEGREVRIFTARASRLNDHPDKLIAEVGEWCRRHIGQVLQVTCEKDFQMESLWDDRAVQVIHNTGCTVQSLVPEGIRRLVNLDSE